MLDDLDDLKSLRDHLDHRTKDVCTKINYDYATK